MLLVADRRHVLVKWRVTPGESQRIIEFVWEEHGGSPAPEPIRQGLGNALIEGAIPDAAARREFHVDSLVCMIQVAYCIMSGQKSDHQSQ